MFRGRDVYVRKAEQDLLCGFYVNEYVWADSESEAITKARRLVEGRLARDPGIRLTSDSLASLEPETVQSGVSWLKLLSREGLSLYPINSSG